LHALPEITAPKSLECRRTPKERPMLETRLHGTTPAACSNGRFTVLRMLESPTGSSSLVPTRDVAARAVAARITAPGAADLPGGDDVDLRQSNLPFRSECTNN